MKTSVGKVIKNESDLEQELVQFYVELLNGTKKEREQDTTTITRNLPRLVTPQHNVMLMRPIKREEVEEVVFQMEKGKASRPDGFTIDFLQSCWDLDKEEIWAVMEESRRTG